MPFVPSQSRRVWMAAVVGTLSLAGAAGCGYENYELRLKQSKDYYNYLEKVDANLAPKWGDGRGILEVRVPKQFVPIPPPQPIKREDGELEMPAVDPRQPDYVNLIFPELLGAWEASVEITLADGGRETRKAYIYAVSNYWTLGGHNPNEEPVFKNAPPFTMLDFTKSLTEWIGAALEQPPKETPETEMHPKPGTYLPSASYNVYRFAAKPITLQVQDRRTSVNYTFEVYDRQNGDIQCPLVVVLPEGIDPREKINERIPMMLEYVNPTKTPPRAGASKVAPASAAPPVAF